VRVGIFAWLANILQISIFDPEGSFDFVSSPNFPTGF